MKICGIDNGLHGAVVCINIDTAIIEIVDTPTLSAKRADDTYDEQAMKELIIRLTPDIVCLEVAQAMPGQGVVSMFKTGFGYGLWRGILVGLGIAYELVRPQAWQKELFTGRSGDTKIVSYEVASALYPSYALQFKGPRGGLKDGRCDALLISEYCRRKHCGKTSSN